METIFDYVKEVLGFFIIACLGGLTRWIFSAKKLPFKSYIFEDMMGNIGFLSIAVVVIIVIYNAYK